MRLSEIESDYILQTTTILVNNQSGLDADTTLSPSGRDGAKNISACIAPSTQKEVEDKYPDWDDLNSPINSGDLENNPDKSINYGPKSVNRVIVPEENKSLEVF